MTKDIQDTDNNLKFTLISMARMFKQNNDLTENFTYSELKNMITNNSKNIMNFVKFINYNKQEIERLKDFQEAIIEKNKQYDISSKKFDLKLTNGFQNLWDNVIDKKFFKT